MNVIKNVSIALLGTAVVTLVAENTAQTKAVAASLVRVSQESAPGIGDFDDNVLGFIEAFSSSQTIKDTYNYDEGELSSFNGPLTLSSNVSHLFLAEATDGLGLFSVHDKPRDKNGGKAKMQFNLLGDTASILVKDDPGDNYTGNGSTFTTKNNWNNLRTDGFAIGSLDGDWTMFAQFTAAPNGLDRWLAFSAAPSELPIELVIDPGRMVRLDFAPEVEEPPVSVPESSSAFGLLAFGLVGAGWRLKRTLQGNVPTASSSAD